MQANSSVLTMPKRSNTLPLKDALIAKLPPPVGTKCAIYRHSKIRGLMLRVWPSGVKTWCLVYSAHVGGKPKQQRYTMPQSFPGLTLDKAERAAEAIVGKIALGQDPAMEKERAKRVVAQRKQGLFGIICDDFVREAVPKMRPTTQAGWRPMILGDIKARWGTCAPTPEEMGRKVIEAWFTELVATKTRSEMSVNRRFQVMRRLFTWAIKQERVEWTPFIRMEKPYSEEPRLRVYTIAELKAIRAAIKLEPVVWQTFWNGVFWTLARRDEVRTMRWPGVEWDDSIWNFLGKGKGKGKPHVLPLVKQAVTRLKAVQAAAALTGDSEYVLVGEDPLKPVVGIQASVYRIRKRPGVPKDFRAHDIRKTGANRLVRNGFCDKPLVRSILNHGAKDVTDTYTQYQYIPEMRVALQKWADWLDKVDRGLVGTKDITPLQSAPSVR